MDWTQYINLSNPFAWTNIVLLIGGLIYFWPKFRERLESSSRRQEEQKTGKRKTLLESIEMLEKQLNNEITARQKLQKELDQLSKEFQKLKQLTTDKETDYLRVNAALERKVKRLESENNTLKERLSACKNK